MNNEQLTLKFIKSLTEKTLKNEIPWEYLDDESNYNLALELDLMAYTTGEYGYANDDYFYFDKDQSFCFPYMEQNMNIVLYISKEDNYPILLIAPFTFKNILVADGSAYISSLTELLNSVKKQFPNPFDFMENFIKD